MSSNLSVSEGLKFVSWRWEHVHAYMTLTLFVFTILIVKLLYSFGGRFRAWIPETSLLVLIGVVFGIILKYSTKTDYNREIWILTPQLFLYVLLPPIVVEAAHHLSRRTFLEIFFPVLSFAIIGTVLNFLLIGGSLFLVDQQKWIGGSAPLKIEDCFLFSSIIVAVDPVAVLAIFQEINVDKVLYFYVFGESLFNDAVTIVLFGVTQSFMQTEDRSTEAYFKAFASFFTVSLGGALVGIAFGIVSALLTRTTRHHRFLEPVVILIMSYLSYLFGDILGWSGIISMIACGMLQASYAIRNMSSKSIQTTRRILKTLSNFSEAIIFVDLGISLFHQKLNWVTGFVLWSLFFMLVARFAVTFALSFLMNTTGLLIKKISLTEQFVMSFGGLRGAVAYILVMQIGRNVFHKPMFESTCLIIILFTILPMGISMKPLVRLLKVKVEESEGLSIFTVLGNSLVDQLATGIESIAGSAGTNTFRELLGRFDRRYIRPFLQNNPESLEEKIVKIYEKVSLNIYLTALKHEKESSRYLNKLCAPLRTRVRSIGSGLLVPNFNTKASNWTVQPLPKVVTDTSVSNDENTTISLSEENYAKLLRNSLRSRQRIDGYDEEDYLSQLNLDIRNRAAIFDSMERETDMEAVTINVSVHGSHSFPDSDSDTKRHCVTTIVGNEPLSNTSEKQLSCAVNESFIESDNEEQEMTQL